MAGQPQDPSPSWQPIGQDQAREAWPPPPSFTPQSAPPPDAYAPPQEAYAPPRDAYAPPPDAYAPPRDAYAPPPDAYAPPRDAYAPPPDAYPSPQDTYVYPPPPVYGQPGQPGPQAPPSQPGQGYPPPTYVPQDQGSGMPYPPQDQGMPQWQASPGRSAAARRPRGEKGFLGSLFDFSFQSMVTPKIIKVLYILITAWVALLALIFLVVAYRTGGLAGGIFVFVIVDPILVLLSLGVYRVILELCMVIFRLHEDVKAIRDRGDGPH